MNNGMYGYGLPPNFSTRVAPPRWASQQAFIVPGTYSFTVPQNVYQIYAFVIGGGGSGAMSQYNPGNSPIAGGGAGGGFASGIIDVIPGQLLPSIVVGAGGASVTSTLSTNVNGNAGGTSSIGSLLTATGGAGGNSGATTNANIAVSAGGTGTVTLLRNSFTASGGSGGGKPNANDSSALACGGGAAGTLFGNGGSGGNGSLESVSNSNHSTGGGGIAGGNGGGTSGNSKVAGGGAFRVSAVDNLGSLNFTQSTGGAGTLGVSPGTTTFGGPGILGQGARNVGSPNDVLASQTALDSTYSLFDFLTNPGIYNGGGGAGTVTTSLSQGAFGGGGGSIFAGSDNNTSGAGGVGGGGGGFAVQLNTTIRGTGGRGGLFAGGGGALGDGEEQTNPTIFAGAGGAFGGGGGGAVRRRFTNPATGTVLSGAGGVGLVLLVWTEGY